MPDIDDVEADRFARSTTSTPESAVLRGTSGLEWGMRNRMARVFSPEDGRTVMLAFDHGYFQGPTSGLEVLEDMIAPLVDDADAIMLTRGALRSTMPSGTRAGLVLRASGGPSVLKELSDERVAMAMDDAVRLNASAVAVQVFVGGEHETQSVQNLTSLVDAGLRSGVPVLAVTAVGKELTRDARYLRLACRIPAELGAHLVKTYHVESGFETITASCPVPVIVAGGRKVDELDALTMAHRAIAEGAAGVDMGRNIFQSSNPAGMLQAIRAVVHDDANPADALDLVRSTATA